MVCLQFREVGFGKCWVLVEYYDKESNGVIWEAVNDHVVEEGVENEELGLQGFDSFI